MTVSSTTNKVLHTGNGSIVSFAYTYRMDNDSDMTVWLDEIEQSADFTVNRNPDNVGGTVDFTTAPASDVIVTLLRVIPETQETDYVPYDAFPAESHEDALDKLTMLVQQVAEEISRSTTVPIGGETDVSYELPTYDAGKALTWSDSAPKKLVNSTDIFNNIVTDASNSAAAAASSESSAASSASIAVGAKDDAEAAAAEALARSLTVPMTFDSVADMVASANLVVGDTAQTVGYYTKGDGGGNIYDIVASGTGTDDGGTYIDLVTHQSKGLFFGSRFAPKQFGAKGDGVTDDGAKINTTLVAFKSKLAERNSSSIDGGAVITLDFQDCVYRTTISLNFTKMTSWGWHITSGTIYGECTGKAVIDGIGSRGGSWSNITVVGDETNMPSTGIQFARSSESGYAFCDNQLIQHCSTIGYFSVAGFHAYGQESTHINHCRWWNYNNTARAAIYEGYNTHVMLSDYTSPITGSTSYINNKYTSVDHRYLPSGKSFFISGITNANPAVVTTTNPHGFSTGDKVSLSGITGITELFNTTHTITVLSTTTFSLDGVDSTAYGVFTGGTAVKSATVSPVYMSRMRNHYFDLCYIVGYGTPSIEYEFPDTQNLNDVRMDFLFEGVGGSELIKFTNVDSAGVDRTLLGFLLNSNEIIPTTSVFSNDSAVKNLIFRSPVIDISSYRFGQSGINLINTGEQSLFRMLSAEITYPVEADFDYTAIGLFSGNLKFNNQNDIKSVGMDGELEDISGSVTVAAQTGALTAYTVTEAYAKRDGKTINLYLVITLDTIGTGAGGLDITFPDARNTAMQGATCCGRNGTDGSMLQSLWTGPSSIRVLKYNNATTITGDGVALRLGMTYEAA